MFWTSMRIKAKLYFSFALVITMFIVAGAAVFHLKRETQGVLHMTLERRVPTTLATLELESHLYQTLGAVRGYLLLGNQQQLDMWQESWTDYEAVIEEVDNRSQHWTLAENVERWKKMKPLLEELHAAQIKAVDYRAKGYEDEAKSVLAQEALPRVREIEALKAALLESNKGLTQADAALALKDLEQIGYILIISTLLAAVVSAAVAALSGRSVVLPLQGLIAIMARMSKGELELAMPSTERADESGDVARALEGFRLSLVAAEKARQDREAAERKANEVQARKVKLTEEFVASSMQIVQALTAAATELQSASQTLTATADRTSQQASSVSAASEEATRNVQAVASAGEELSSSISEISRQVSTSSQIAGKAANEARTTNERIQGLAQAADRIGEVLKLISDIAEQTNLLALNATIEAARAGDAGKGFAVVAAEVKNLANQTAKATEEIGAKIFEMQSATAESVSAIRSINGTIGEINEIAGAIAAAVEEQGAATSEISRNVREAATGTSEVSSNVVEVSQAAGETGSAAVQVQGAAGELSQLAERMRRQVNDFVTTLNAA